LRAAAAGLFQARWSDEILKEATRNLVADGVVTEQQAVRLRAAMIGAFPEARVTGFDNLVATMRNDTMDRHVAAAAVKAKARAIATLNVRDRAAQILCDLRDLDAGEPGGKLPDEPPGARIRSLQQVLKKLANSGVVMALIKSSP
jgi:hypothetical protein